MKSKNIFKILLDAAMTVLFCVLTFLPQTGIVFHEVGGMLLFAMFVAHLLLNARVIKALLEKSGAAEAPLRIKLLLALDGLLAVCIVVLLVTSVLISQVIFSITLPFGAALASAAHHLSAYIGIGVMGVHLLMHAKYLVNAVKAMLAPRASVAVRRCFVEFALGCAIFAFAYLYVSPLLKQRTFATTEQSTPQIVIEDSSEPASNAAQIVKDESDAQSADSGEIAAQSETMQATVTLEDYMSGLTCTGCGKRCLLTNPRCGRGEQQAQQAEAAYYEQYPSQTALDNI
jgi:hypothetical protein